MSDLTGVLLPLKFFPDENDSAKSYLQVLEQVKFPSCAIVAVPDHLHYEVASACLEKGLHTLVVKPLTPNVKEAKKLVSLAKKQNLYGAVEFHKRWDRQNRILHDLFQKGNLWAYLSILGLSIVKESPYPVRFEVDPKSRTVFLMS